MRELDEAKKIPDNLHFFQEVSQLIMDQFSTIFYPTEIWVKTMRFPVGQAYRVAVGVGFSAQRAAHPVLWRRHMAGDGFFP